MTPAPGELIRQAMRARQEFGPEGMPLGELARRLNRRAGQPAQHGACNATTLRRYLKGERSLFNARCPWREHIEAELGIDLAASYRESEGPPGTPRTEGEPEEVDVERRQFFGLSAVAVGLATDPWERLAAAVTAPRVDAEVTEQLVNVTANFFTREHHLREHYVPVERLAAYVTDHLNTLTALIPRATDPYRSALLVAAGETATLAGWASFEVGDERSARHYYETAQLAAREAGHPAVTALAMGYASYSCEPDEARRMLAGAQRHVRGPGYATARSWLAAREAEEAAKSGEREVAVRALDRAETAFDYGDPDAEQAWVKFYRRPRLDSLAVSTFAQLQHQGLEQSARDALEHLGDDDSKVSIAVLSDVATGYLVAGNVEQGVEVGHRFLDAATAMPTTMGKKRMAALEKLLPARQSAARDLSESIRVALTA